MGPRTRYVIGTILVYVLLGSAMRGMFYFLFRDGALAGEGVGHAFFVGAKFDLRLALLLALPFFALSRVRVIDPARSTGARNFWASHSALVGLALLSVYVADLGHYGYLNVRLDAASLRFLANPLISAQMVWETYPVIWWALGLVAATAGLFFGFRIMLDRAFTHGVPQRTWKLRLAGTVAGVLLCCAGLYGKASFYPLRWSDAFVGTNHFSSHLALNPALYFIDTLCTDDGDRFDEDATRESYEVVAEYLGVDDLDPEGLSYVRRVRPTIQKKARPNVVVVLLESFAAHHCGSFGNPLDPSPRFDEAAKNGQLFAHFYSPRHGTARAVFASVTGVPDGVARRTATRNPRIIDQQTVFDAIEGYDKYYFLGGSANWANIRGLLKNNIRGLTIREEGDFTAPRTDVWGISDLHLFEDANRVFRAPRDKPFLALIHCSGNHRPYTIPDDNRGFEWRDVDADKLHAHGFIDIDEFNSFRFLDHSIGFFLDEARKEPYFENTIFMFYGDNGTPGRADHMPVGEKQLGLDAHHTPFLIYGPGVLDGPRRIARPAGQCDVMATVAGLVGSQCINTAIGRNLLDPRFAERESFAYIQMKRGTDLFVRLVGERFVASIATNGGIARLHDMSAADATADIGAQHPEQLAAMREIGLGLYRTTQWLLYHNNRARYEEQR